MAFQRVEAYNLISFQAALDGVFNELEAAGLDGKEGEPDITIVMRNTSNIDASGVKLVDVVVYTGAQLPEVAADLTQRQTQLQP